MTWHKLRYLLRLTAILEGDDGRVSYRQWCCRYIYSFYLITPFEYVLFEWETWRWYSLTKICSPGVLEANFIEPAHDKQDFERSSLFQRLEARLKKIVTDYWSLLPLRSPYSNHLSIFFSHYDFTNCNISVWLFHCLFWKKKTGVATATFSDTRLLKCLQISRKGYRYLINRRLLSIHSILFLRLLKVVQ